MITIVSYYTQDLSFASDAISNMIANTYGYNSRLSVSSDRGSLSLRVILGISWHQVAVFFSHTVSFFPKRRISRLTSKWLMIRHKKCQTSIKMISRR